MNSASGLIAAFVGGTLYYLMMVAGLIAVIIAFVVIRRKQAE